LNGKAFEKVKDMLIPTPVLHTTNFWKSFIKVAIDASDARTGAVFSKRMTRELNNLFRNLKWAKRITV